MAKVHTGKVEISKRIGKDRVNDTASRIGVMPVGMQPFGHRPDTVMVRSTPVCANKGTTDMRGVDGGGAGSVGPDWAKAEATANKLTRPKNREAKRLNSAIFMRDGFFIFIAFRVFTTQVNIVILNLCGNFSRSHKMNSTPINAKRKSHFQRT